MYTCMVDGEYFHFPTANKRECALLSGTITTELNRAGTFDFQIPPTNLCYKDNKFKKMISEVEVFWNGDRLFRGRILDETRSFLGQINYKCEGWMSVLNDSIVIPEQLGLTGDDEKGITTTVATMFTALINLHNSQMGNSGFNVNKKFPTIEVKGAFASKSVNFPWPSNEKTLDYIQSNLLSNDEVGGMLQVESNAIYLVDMNDNTYKVNAKQEIRQGVNLLDLTQTIDATEVYTIIYATGKDGLKIAGSGTIESGYTKPGNGTIEATNMIPTFSRIFHYEDFSDVEDAATLESRALQALKNSCEIPPSIDISALDLNIIDSDQPRLQVGQFVTVSVPHYDFEMPYMCTSSTVDICNPANTKFMLGKTVDTMTTKQLSIARNVQKSALKYGAEIASKNLDINVYDARVRKDSCTFYKTNKTVYLNFSVTFLKSVTSSSPSIMTFNTDHAPIAEVTGTAFDETTSTTYTMKVTTTGYVQIIAYGDGIAVDDVVTGNLTWMVK